MVRLEHKPSVNQFYVTYTTPDGTWLSPVDITMFLRLVNLQSFPTAIQELAFEMKVGNYDWVRLASIWTNTVRLFWVGDTDGLKKCREIGTDTALGVLLQNKTLQSHETVRGWVSLDAQKPYLRPWEQLFSTA